MNNIILCEKLCIPINLHCFACSTQNNLIMLIKLINYLLNSNSMQNFLF